MSKPIVFDQDEVALCPNGHGPMLMLSETEHVGEYMVPETRAFCRKCFHTMIVADERR